MKKSFLALAVIGVVGLSANAALYGKGDWLVRVGLTNVPPESGSSPILARGAALGV